MESDFFRLIYQLKFVVGVIGGGGLSATASM